MVFQELYFIVLTLKDQFCNLTIRILINQNFFIRLFKIKDSTFMIYFIFQYFMRNYLGFEFFLSIRC